MGNSKSKIKIQSIHKCDANPRSHSIERKYVQGLSMVTKKIQVKIPDQIIKLVIQALEKLDMLNQVDKLDNKNYNAEKIQYVLKQMGVIVTGGHIAGLSQHQEEQSVVVKMYVAASYFGCKELTDILSSILGYWVSVTTWTDTYSLKVRDYYIPNNIGGQISLQKFQSTAKTTTTPYVVRLLYYGLNTKLLRPILSHVSKDTKVYKFLMTRVPVSEDIDHLTSTQTMFETSPCPEEIDQSFPRCYELPIQSFDAEEFGNIFAIEKQIQDEKERKRLAAAAMLQAEEQLKKDEEERLQNIRREEKKKSASATQRVMQYNNTDGSSSYYRSYESDLYKSSSSSSSSYTTAAAPIVDSYQVQRDREEAERQSQFEEHMRYQTRVAEESAAIIAREEEARRQQDYGCGRHDDDHCHH